MKFHVYYTGKELYRKFQEQEAYIFRIFKIKGLELYIFPGIFFMIQCLPLNQQSQFRK